jgi:hypothetical protein
MANGNADRHRHFILDRVTSTEPFQTPSGGGGGGAVPRRDRRVHGSQLLGQIEELKVVAESVRDEQRAAEVEGGIGLQVEFESFPDVELAFESLSRERSGIELLNVRHDQQTTYATVFVPGGKLEHFENLIRDYLEEKRDSAGRARDNQRLIDAIRGIRAASLRALWTDDPAVFPSSDHEAFWWEVWLPVRGDRRAAVAAFRERAAAQEMRAAPGELGFPERTVLLVYGSTGQMKRSVLMLNSIAELRRAKETADFFDSLPPAEQPEWLDELLSRTQHASATRDVPYVCILDTGINRGHPWISPALAETDLHSVEPGWGTDDAHGHGTNMAGLALAGDLTAPLSGNAIVEIEHRIESVKLLPHDDANDHDPRHHGYLTTEAVARPEITAPNRRRVFMMPITAKDNRDRGRPSAWSAAVDAIAADAEAQGENPRLLVVSAGNTDPNAWADYPASNDTDGIHDPAQAWNALTVGACTHLVRITEPDASGYNPTAESGGLSPFSTTSLTWQPQWPLKPDVLFEGGNTGKNSSFASEFASLSLLTTHHRPVDHLFTTANATSAATALAARMAAQIMAVYPELWPETVRALIVHSAGWTGCMRRQYLPNGRGAPGVASIQPLLPLALPASATRGGNATKEDHRRLIQRCGFGIPNLERALWSVSNSLTIVVQDQLHPFQREGGKQPALRDMQLHRLPWPQGVLEELGETAVELRVTLSYFIEPNPSQRGVRSRYRYESHGLRFDVKRPQESLDGFRRRINVAARDEEAGSRRSGNDPGWLLGTQARHRGSLHSDVWRGTAADLASRGALAIYPVTGWWKTRPALERYNQAARYSLVVSIRAPEVAVDLYNEIANLISTAAEVEV